MEMPICRVCLKSEMLCRACEDKLKQGKVSDADVRISRALFRLSEKLKPLQSISLRKVVETERVLIIICGKGSASKLVGRSGIVVKKLSRELGKNVRVVEEADDIRDFAAGLLAPANIVSVGKLYKSDGNEVIRAVVSRFPHVQISARDFSEVIERVYGEKAEIAVE